MSTKLTNNIETFLQSPKGVKKSWIRTILTMTLCTIMFIIIISLSFQYGPLSGQAQFTGLGTSFYQVVNAPYLEAGTWIAVSGLCILVIPFIYLFAVWMMGINQVSSSKQFHLFLWIITFILVILALLTMILLIRASIFSINSTYIQISPPTPPETPPENPAPVIMSILNNFFKA